MMPRKALETMAKRRRTGHDTMACGVRHPCVGSSMMIGSSVSFQEEPAFVIILFKEEAITLAGSPDILTLLNIYPRIFSHHPMNII
jgi:hypothetical protein